MEAAKEYLYKYLGYQINEEKFITENIPIPNRTYVVDKISTAQILKRIKICKRKHLLENNYIENLTDTVEFIFNNIKHISFIEFVKKLTESVRMFEKTIGDNEFVLLIPAFLSKKKI